MSHLLLKIVGTANGLSLSAGNGISLGLASSGVTGALSGTDWNTFNGKLNLSSVLTGFVLGADGTALTATDTILQAYQKLQVQSNAKAPLANPVFTGSITLGGAGGNVERGALLGNSSSLPSAISANQGGTVCDFIPTSAATGFFYQLYSRQRTATAAYTVALSHAHLIGSPVFGAGSTITSGCGLTIQNQGHAQAVTSSAIKIENQSGSGTNYALETGTGLVSIGDDATFLGQITLAASKGLQINTGAPGVTTNKLYQIGGNLYFNGVQLAAGGINLSSPITGYAIGSDGTKLAATDTVLQAFQKLQYQMFGTQISAPAYSATMTLDGGLFDVIRVTLTGALTMNMLTTGVQDGHRVLVELTQDATGTRLVTLGTGIAYGTDITGFTATTTPSKTDILGFEYNTAAAKYRLIAVAKGY